MTNLMYELCLISFFLIYRLVEDEERVAPSDAMDILCYPEWQATACYDDQNTHCW